METGTAAEGSHLLLDAVRQTVKAGTARLTLYSRYIDPEPEDSDLVGEGLADLTGYRAVFRRRRGLGITPRTAAKFRRRPAFGLLFGRPTRRYKEIYVVGPQVSKRRRNGSWSSFDPSLDHEGKIDLPDEIADPEWHEVMENPLWPLKPVARVRLGFAEIGSGEPVRGDLTRRYSVPLTAEHMSEHAWRWLACRRTPRKARRDYEPEPLQTFVWIDDEGRIRRISWQSTVFHIPPDSESPPIPETSWEILELWDFGVDVDGAFPG